jgi:hypothetical protein
MTTTTSSAAPMPWDRQTGEPPAAYARFLIFRALGPARSLGGAYGVYLGEPDAKRPAPGRWRRDSVRWSWQERAVAWDIDQLSTQGIAAIAAFVAAVNKASLCLLEAMFDPNIRIADWGQIAELLEVIGRHVPTELVAKAAAAGEQPADPRPFPRRATV